MVARLNSIQDLAPGTKEEPATLNLGGAGF